MAELAGTVAVGQRWEFQANDVGSWSPFVISRIKRDERFGGELVAFTDSGSFMFVRKHVECETMEASMSIARKRRRAPSCHEQAHAEVEEMATGLCEDRGAIERALAELGGGVAAGQRYELVREWGVGVPRTVARLDGEFVVWADGSRTHSMYMYEYRRIPASRDT